MNKGNKIELKAKSAFGMQGHKPIRLYVLKVPLRQNIKPTRFEGHPRKSRADFFL